MIVFFWVSAYFQGGGLLLLVSAEAINFQPPSIDPQILQVMMVDEAHVVSPGKAVGFSFFVGWRRRFPKRGAFVRCVCML